MNSALRRVSPDRVIRTKPVPDAHSSSEKMAPKYLRISTTLPFSASDKSRCHCGDGDHNQGSSLGYGDGGTDRHIGIYGSAKDVHL